MPLTEPLRFFTSFYISHDVTSLLIEVVVAYIAIEDIFTPHYIMPAEFSLLPKRRFLHISRLRDNTT
jgi:hypothetical protein